MHYLGGVVMGLLLYTIHDLGVSLVPHRPRWFTTFLFVMLAAVVWEIYEILVGRPILDDYVLDTIIDLILGGLGGLTSFYVADRLRNESI